MNDNNEILEPSQESAGLVIQPDQNMQQVLATFAQAMGSKAVMANGFQLLKVEGHLRLSFSETAHPAIPPQPRGAVLISDQSAKDLATNILEFYRRTEELAAMNAESPGGVN